MRGSCKKLCVGFVPALPGLRMFNVQKIALPPSPSLQPLLPPIERWLDANFDRSDGPDPMEYLDSANIIGRYAELFGAEHVYIDLFERLVEDRSQFIHRLCQFMEIDPDEGIRLTNQRHENHRWHTRRC